MFEKDTIVALATPPGIGAIGVIRLSGENAITIANHCFYGRNNNQVLLSKKTHTLSFGKIVSEGVEIDEVVASFFSCSVAQ